MKRFFLGLVLSLIAVPLTFSSARSDLVLQIDAGAKTFAFSGSSNAGTPSTVNVTEGLTNWQITGLSGVEVGTLSSNNKTLFSTTGGPGNEPGNSLGYDTRFVFSNAGSITLNFATSENILQTYTGTGTFVSYSSLTAGNETAFESLVGQTLSLNTGSGFGNVSVVAVPEPATMLLTGSVLAAGFGASVLRRFRKKSEEQAAA